MSHADIQTTMRYLHYAPREDDAALVAEAFSLDERRPPPRDKRSAADQLPLRDHDRDVLGRA
jgi:hypothetical protein